MLQQCKQSMEERLGLLSLLLVCATRARFLTVVFVGMEKMIGSGISTTKLMQESLRHQGITLLQSSFCHRFTGSQVQMSSCHRSSLAETTFYLHACTRRRFQVAWPECKHTM
jgi:hypothetical protein